ncbi:MAG: phosphatidylserine decarboxylase [Moraxellaceae bacterium]|jgi:phosphatidylserine decarboxylase|nr:phosphatidylserine decarboxylase [Moraxellaceae bacterium]
MKPESRDRLLTLIQYFVPQHLLSRFVGWIAASRLGFVKNTFIANFAARYNVDMREALEENPLAYESFNAFFTRPLKAGARVIDTTPGSIACPADGAISQLGEIEGNFIFQAKGQQYTLNELLGGDVQRAHPFLNGKFATVYLSPRDYHRVHMPYTGTLREMVYVPGDLFSVNTRTAENVPRLFARNERLVAIFDTDIGPMAVVLVGAMIVAGIETVWAGRVAPARPRRITVTDYRNAPAPIVLKKGDELGRFYLGSTAIVCFGHDVMDWESRFRAGTPTRMGEKLGGGRR